MRVAVLGASVAGLGAGLLLARDGHEVVLVDRDPETGAAPPPGGAAVRRATPQAAHSHVFVARLRTLLAERAPDVLDRIFDEGARPLVLRDALPAGIAELDHPALADPDLVALAARRATLEAALRRVVLAEPGIEVVAGVGARGLLVDHPLDGSPPRVTGLALEDGRRVGADLVVDASGRRTPVPGWLAAATGVELPLHVTDCGISYLTRFHRSAPGVDQPPLTRGHTAGSSFDRYSCLVFAGDDRTFSVTFGVLPEDRSLRGLTDGDAFTAAVAAIPAVAPWLEGAVPIGDVATMTGLKNRLRRHVSSGRPLVLGLAGCGDAVATTNPAHSRGTTLAFVQAAGIADAVAAHGRDLGGLALALDHLLTTEQAPWVADSEEQDAARLARWRADGPKASVGTPPPPGARVTNGEANAAAQRDPVVWQRFTRLQHLLERPDDVLADAAVVARVRAAGPPPPPAGPAAPDHDALATLVMAHGSGHVRRRGLVVAGRRAVATGGGSPPHRHPPAGAGPPLQVAAEPMTRRTP